MQDATPLTLARVVGLHERGMLADDLDRIEDALRVSTAGARWRQWATASIQAGLRRGRRSGVAVTGCVRQRAKSHRARALTKLGSLPAHYVPGSVTLQDRNESGDVLRPAPGFAELQIPENETRLFDHAGQSKSDAAEALT